MFIKEHKQNFNVKSRTLAKQNAIAFFITRKTLVNLSVVAFIQNISKINYSARRESAKLQRTVSRNKRCRDVINNLYGALRGNSGPNFWKARQSKLWSESTKIMRVDGMVDDGLIPKLLNMLNLIVAQNEMLKRQYNQRHLSYDRYPNYHSGTWFDLTS